MDLSVCACCVPTVVIGILLFSWVFLKITGSMSNWFTKGSLLGKFISIALYVTNFLVIATAIGIGALGVSPNVRSRFFAALITKMTASPAMDPMRCGVVAGASGRVLEFGFGPATNFRCWRDASISEWVGVDPNTNFEGVIAAQQYKYNLSFPTSTVWLAGEDVDVPVESFDTVVATHTLCSVNDVSQVLKQINRALKPGGTYFFMEHVAAPEGTVMRVVQRILGPIFHIVGNGCRFKELWRDLTDSTSLRDFDVDLTHVQAPAGLPPLAPHVIGKATKRKPVADTSEEAKS